MRAWMEPLEWCNMPSSTADQCPLAEQLQDTYFKYQQSARLPKRLAVKASPPLLMHPHSRWKSAKLRVLVVGQETLRWKYNPDEVGGIGSTIENFLDFQQAKDGVGAMWMLYRWYAFGRADSNLNSPFWRGFRALNLAINGCEDSGLWTNVFKVNVRGSVMRNCKAAELSALRRAQQGLLHHEITILKPDVVVFFSGPRYDSTIQGEFPDMEIKRFCRRMPESAVGVVRAAGLPSRTIRTYHPEYLQRSNQLGILSEICQWATGETRMYGRGRQG
jgi:hypothetical protein